MVAKDKIEFQKMKEKDENKKLRLKMELDRVLDGLEVKKKKHQQWIE